MDCTCDTSKMNPLTHPLNSEVSVRAGNAVQHPRDGSTVVGLAAVAERVTCEACGGQRFISNSAVTYSRGGDADLALHLLAQAAGTARRAAAMMIRDACPPEEAEAALKRFDDVVSGYVSKEQAAIRLPSGSGMRAPWGAN